MTSSLVIINSCYDFPCSGQMSVRHVLNMFPHYYFRYQNNRKVLREGMKEMGFQEFLDSTHKGYIITSYRFPSDPNFIFKDFYSELSDLGMCDKHVFHRECECTLRYFTLFI